MMTTSPFKVTNYANGFIRTYDNFLNPSEYDNVISELTNLSFVFGETDESNTPPSGVICNLDNKNIIHKTLFEKLSSLNVLDNCYCDRSYVNLYSPNERTYFHHDFTDYTVLYYPGPSWNINDEGETKFFFTTNPFDSIIQEDSEDMPIMISIAPVPNRLVIFNGDVLHSATSFRDKHRYSIALKFLRNQDEH